MSGPQCCENPPTLSPSSGVGSVVEVGGLKTYVSDSKLAVLLASDVFGYEAPNLRTDCLRYVTLAKACEDAKPVIEALKSRGISAIGAAGFCYGAKVVVELAKSGLIQAGVLLHLSFVTEDDTKEVEAPLAILAAEIDNFTPPDLVASFVKIFPGIVHGWTVRYKSDDETAVKSAEEAHEDMLNWWQLDVPDCRSPDEAILYRKLAE
ncbi:UNVERIFIED_CONTAM: 1,4-beta-D-glucanase [Sesamum indicum]